MKVNGYQKYQNSFTLLPEVTNEPLKKAATKIIQLKPPLIDIDANYY